MPPDDISKWLKLAIVSGILVSYAAILAGLFTWTIPPDNRDIAYMVIGGLTSILTTIVNYFFGSSKSSQEKDATIDHAIKQLGK